MTIRLPKTLMLALVVLALGALAAFYFLKSDTADALARTIETRGSHVLGTRVSVADVDTDWENGGISLSHLTVTNPGGFGKRDMLQVDKVTVRGDLKDRVIRQIGLHGVRVMIEFRGTRTNVESLDRRMSAAAATEAPSASSGSEGSGSESGERSDDHADSGSTASDEWRIESIQIGNIRVIVRADWSPKTLRFKSDGMTVESLDAGTDDLVRAVATRFLYKVLATAAGKADDDRLRKALMEKVEALRARTKKPDMPKS